MIEQEKRKVIINFRVGFTSICSSLLIAILPLLIHNTAVIQQLQILCPILSGGLAYGISIPFNYFILKIDAKRYQDQLNNLDHELINLDKEKDQERITEIIKDKATYRRKIFDINSQSLFD